MPAQLRIIDRILIPALLRDDILHLPHQRPTRVRDRPTRRLEPILRFRHELRFDATGGDELGRAGGDVVRSHDQLLGTVAVADDAVGRLDQHVGRAGDGFGGADQAFGPSVVFLVEGGARGAAAPVFDDLLLGCGGGAD